MLEGYIIEFIILIDILIVIIKTQELVFTFGRFHSCVKQATFFYSIFYRWTKCGQYIHEVVLRLILAFSLEVKTLLFTFQ